MENEYHPREPAAEDGACGLNLELLLTGSLIAVGLVFLGLFLFLTRYDEDVNSYLTQWVIAAEHKRGSEMSLLRHVLGVSLRFNAEDAFAHVANQDKKALSFLLKLGLDANLRNEAGVPLFLAAVRAKNVSAVDLLLRAGADANATDPDGLTALALAVRESSLEIVELLLSARVNLDSTDRIGLTPLLYAIQARNLALMQRLIIAGAKIDAQTAEGKTPLMYAAALGSDSMVNALLQAGAKPDILDSSGRDALAYVGDTPGSAETRGLLELYRGAPAASPGAASSAQPASQSDEETMRLLAQVAADQFAEQESDSSTSSAQPVKKKEGKAAQKKPTPESLPFTRLRILGSAKASWQPGPKTILDAVTVDVRNFGPAPAKGISVIASLPNGTSLRLAGPQALEPFETATYEAAPKHKAVQMGRVTAEVTCSNCFR